MTTPTPLTAQLTPSPDHPGWLEWNVGAAQQFNRAVLGPMIVRAEPGDRATVRLPDVRTHMGNAGGAIHGGALMGFIDTAMFAAVCAMRDASLVDGVTLDCQVQFLAPGTLGKALDADVEVVRETGRLIFLRGILAQDGPPICSFSGIIRKVVR